MTENKIYIYILKKQLNPFNQSFHSYLILYFEGILLLCHMSYRPSYAEVMLNSYSRDVKM